MIQYDQGNKHMFEFEERDNIMYVVTETNNYLEEGQAFVYQDNEKEDARGKLEELYKEYMRIALALDRERTYINKEHTYAQVSDGGICVNEFRLIAC